AHSLPRSLSPSLSPSLPRSHPGPHFKNLTATSARGKVLCEAGFRFHLLRLTETSAPGWRHCVCVCVCVCVWGEVLLTYWMLAEGRVCGKTTGAAGVLP